jgi:two-component system sensor histidine kinase MprB
VPWQIYGDAAGLSRAVLNLMDNAAKWSPPGGRVGVTMRRVDPSHVELLVSDQGPGIPPHERDLVFERFFRSATARAMPGSGLGLAIVKQVVLKHGGALRVEDAVPGGEPPGSSFYVLLPGAPIPVVPGTEGEDDAKPDVTPAAKQGNSPGAANVVSVDSQSTRAR